MGGVTGACSPRARITSFFDDTSARFAVYPIVRWLSRPRPWKEAILILPSGSRPINSPSNRTSPVPTVTILTAEMTALSFEDFVETVTRWGQAQDRGRMVCVANVHMLVEARRDPSLAQSLRRADAVTPDGMPLVWLMRRNGHPNQDRIAGMDLLPALCDMAERESISVYFLGSTPEVLRAIRCRLRSTHPRLRIGGMDAPPFREMTPDEEALTIQRINLADPGFLFVALGCPKQEKWMERNVENVRAVMFGLGAAFPVFAGARKRAPRVMQRNGMEWLYRLCQEPHRLWRRYLTTNTAFLWWIYEGWRSEQRSAGREPRLD